MVAVNGKRVPLVSGGEQELPTRADYDAASPRGKGYMQYMFSEWPGSQIPKRCPVKVGTKEYEQYCAGQNAAVLDAQDGDDE